MKTNLQVKNIFVAVFDKSVLDELLKILDKKSVNFWGTEGSVKYVRSKGFSAKSVIRGFEYGGRVKSLDRANFVRLLADVSKSDHVKALKKEKLEPIDMVIVDLYVPDPKIFPDSMDIGGQALIRSAIKNYKNVALAFNETSIKQLILHLIKNNNSTTLSFRKEQAKKGAAFIAKRGKLEEDLFKKVV